MLKKTQHIQLGKYGFDQWYVVDSKDYNGVRYYMMENEYFGDALPCVIIDAHMNIIVEHAYNGWEDLYEELEGEE